MTRKAEKRIFTFLKRELGKEKSQIISLNSWKNTGRDNAELADTGFGRTKEVNTGQQIFFENKSCKIKLISFLEKVTGPEDNEKTADVLKFILSQASDLLYLTFS